MFESIKKMDIWDSASNRSCGISLTSLHPVRLQSL